jgi:hypothetical protein
MQQCRLDPTGSLPAAELPTALALFKTYLTQCVLLSWEGTHLSWPAAP